MVVSGPIWDGIDFDPDLRRFIGDCVVPVAFLLGSGVLVASTATKALYSLYKSKRTGAIILGEDSGPSPKFNIARSENDMLRSIMVAEATDLTLRDIDKLSFPLIGDNHLDVSDEVIELKPVSLTDAMEIIVRSYRDFVTLFLSGMLLSLSLAKLVRKRDALAWCLVASWIVATLFNLTKLVLTLYSRLKAFSYSMPRKIPSFYTPIEMILDAFYIMLLFPAFFEYRSALLFGLADARLDSIAKRTFVILSILLAIEVFSPQASRFRTRRTPTVDPELVEIRTAALDAQVKATHGERTLGRDGKPIDPPPAHEVGASLFSLGVFWYMNKMLFRAAFPRLAHKIMGVDSEKVPHFAEIVPELEPDHNTARVLVDFRSDTLFLTKTGKNNRTLLIWRLIWHFRWKLSAQCLWSIGHVSCTSLLPILLQAFLKELDATAKGTGRPKHVAFLYATGILVFQSLGSMSTSQALLVGRRICIRLRSILVAEVFAKALRRKDASSAGESIDDTPEEQSAPAPDVAGIADVDGMETPAGEPEDAEAAPELATNGRILNLVGVDTYKVSEICAYLHYVFPEMVLLITTLVYLLFRVLGWAALAGLLTMSILLPFEAWISMVFFKLQKKYLGAADKRLNMASEVITSIKVVKYFAWEDKFLEKMNATRRVELDSLWNLFLCLIVNGIATSGTPVIVSLATFTCHTQLLHRPLTAPTAFTALTLFNLLRSPIERFADMMASILQAYTSLTRLAAYLDEEETQKYEVVETPGEDDPALGFVDATLTWAPVSDAAADLSIFRLQNLNLSFPTGALSIVIGPVGSGKSSLLVSLLGETNVLSGHVFAPLAARPAGTDPTVLTDSLAYCAQSAWLLSDTVRENILFGHAFNAKRYDAVLDACALRADLAHFTAGDATEVGEKGTVLSGGQKARIALARAIYSSARTVLLDDVLSAVDAHTAQHLYAKVFKGPLMAHRTCVLVTHAVDLCLPGADFIVSMESGIVIKAGSPQELFGTEAAVHEEDVEQLVAAIAINPSAILTQAPEDETPLDPEEERAREAKDESLKLIKAETTSEGSISRDVFIMYGRALGGGWMLVGIVTLFAVAQLSEILANTALRFWAGSYANDDAVNIVHMSKDSVLAMAAYFSPYSSNTAAATPVSIDSSLLGSADQVILAANDTLIALASNAPEHSHNYWLIIYAALGGLSLCLFGVRFLVFALRSYGASMNLYAQLIRRILGAPTRFFDSTPTGRILNRLSKDVEVLDQEVSSLCNYFLYEFIAVVGTIATISFVLPWFMVAAVFITITYGLIGYLYVSASLELKRFESLSKSPILSIIGETLSGVTSIRAYGDTSRFMKKLVTFIDVNNKPFFALWLSNRWLSVCADLTSALITFTVASILLFAPGVDAAIGGFVISYAMAFNERILWLVRLSGLIEISFNSIERIKEYMDLDQEKQGGIEPPATWPSRAGTIEVEELTASYAPGLPPALNKVSFKVLPKEKIGICGRTGSGKSTLGLSFFRFIEPTSGRIVIDGIDIGTVKLSELRRKITIVAQEAALFAGSMRFNLDPFGRYSDEDLWDALVRVHLARPGGPGTGTGTAVPSRIGSVANVKDLGSTSRVGSLMNLSDSSEGKSYPVKSLDMEISEGGKNLSAGQRQLVSLARGLLGLKTTSLLILDESTASLDQAMDDKIQETIRTEMFDATILCIAHRLKTIINFDKILVMGTGGHVLEFDSPANLLADPESHFTELCKKSGEYELLLEMAKK